MSGFKLWDGHEPLNGKRVLVDGRYSYLGDCVQYLRYLTPLKDAGATVCVLVRREFVPLVSLQEGIDTWNSEDAPNDYDFAVALVQLPSLLRAAQVAPLERLPVFKIPPERVSEVSRRIGSSSFNIGLCWRVGSKVIYPGRQGADRNVSLSAFQPLMQIPGVKLYSLQRGGGSVLREIAAFPALIDLEAGPGDIVGTAAAILALDLIISVDTMVAHLAGTLGRPVWTLLLKFPDWRWGPFGTRTLLYPTMTLFRQPTLDDWKSVFGAIDYNIKTLVRHRSAVIS